MKLLLASGNAKKLIELRAFLSQVNAQVVGPEEIGGLPEVVEDGATFAANAAKKALSAARASGLWSLADDSGLEVRALNGAPGVHSARFSGPGATDARNNALLLERMAAGPSRERNARFVCALALARPDATLYAEVEGTCRGVVTTEPRGANDFGYDPLFEFAEPGHAQTGYTFAELEPEEKSSVSHRGRALDALRDRIDSLLCGSPSS